MGIRQTKSIERRQREIDERFQHFVPSQEPTVKTTKIIDLNDDCLVQIFNHLSLESLFNVAIANEWLRPAAGIVYNRKFGKKRVGIYECADYYPSILSSEYQIHEEERGIRIRIYGLRLCLQYLRCFGGLITDLVIHYDKSKSKRYQYVHHYINDYCTTSLTHILFMNRPKISIDRFTQPFINVTDVCVSCCKLGKQLPHFAELFPNLQRLTLCHVRLSYGFERAPFQHLEHFCVHTGSKNGFRIHDATNLLRMNPQLQSLEIQCHGKKITLNSFLDVVKENQSLIKCIVNFQFAIISVHSSEVQRLINEHPSLIELGLAQYQFTADDVIALTQQLKSLTTFKFSMQNSSDLVELEARLDHKWVIINGWKHCRIEVNRKY